MYLTGVSLRKWPEDFDWYLNRVGQKLAAARENGEAKSAARPSGGQMVASQGKELLQQAISAHRR